MQDLTYGRFRARKQFPNFRQEEVEKMKTDLVSEAELEKVKNKTESMIAFEDMTIMNRAKPVLFGSSSRAPTSYITFTTAKGVL